jgi:putative endonuclease
VLSQGETLYAVYILHSPSLNRYYVGQTADLASRMGFHAAGKTAATSKGGDWLVVFVESFATRLDAMRLETQIKRTKSKKSISRYISDPRNKLTAPVRVAAS